MSRYEWQVDDVRIKNLEKATESIRLQIVSHSLYSALDNSSAVQTFMEHHVYAVWDFMSLLKSLQRELTCIDVPWLPTSHKTSRRLINDIVLIEESDEIEGSFASHFELYLQGMAEAEADCARIDAFLNELRRPESVQAAIEIANVPAPSANFMRSTFEFVADMPLHCRAAMFAFGREDLIPAMFEKVIEVNDRVGNLNHFISYLERHIEVDGEEHTPMAMQMVSDLCGDDDQKWQASSEAVKIALEARLKLWDGILDAIKSDVRKEMVTSGAVNDK